jgi:hypothetical protein
LSTPCDPNVDFEINDGVSKPVDKTMYQSMVGSLLYLALVSRPDISYAVGLMSRFSHDPNAAHLTGVKRIGRYLKGTPDYGLIYSEDKNELKGYSDADWGGCRDSRRSTSGNIFMFSGAAISWSSKRQTVVALSSAEAEYRALTPAAQEAIWLRGLSADLEMPCSDPMIIYEDNKSAICIAENTLVSAKTKHIQIREHFIRDCVQSKLIALVHCPTDQMIADILTKPLSRVKFEVLRKAMGVARD